MESSPVPNILASLVSLLGIWVLCFVFYRSYRVDVFRHKMFALRDSFFDEAAAGRISFEAPAYGLLRSTMNGFIRFAHRVSFMQVILAGLFATPEDRRASSFNAAMTEATEKLTLEQRRCLEWYQLRMNLLVAEHFVFGSPVVVAVIVPVALYLTAKKLLLQLLSRFGTLEAVDSAALACGQQ